MTEPCDLSALEARRADRRAQALARGAAGELPRAHREHQPGGQRHRRHGRGRGAQARRRRSSRPSAAARRWACWPGCRSASRICRRPRGSGPPRARCCSRTTCRAEDEFGVANVRKAGGVILGKTNTPEFGAGANTTNRVYGADRQSVRSRPRPAPAPPAARRWRWRWARCRSPPAPTTAAACARRPRSAASPASGRRPAWCRASIGAASLSPFSVHGPMGRTIADAHLLLRAQVCRDKRDPFSSRDVEGIPAELTGADLGQPARRRLARSRLRAGRSPHRRDSSRSASAASAMPSARSRSARPTSPACTRSSRRCAACTSSPRTASGWRRRATCSTATSSTTPSAASQLSLGDVARAHVEQTQLYKRVLAFFQEVDVLICPAASVSPFPHSQLFVEEIDGERMPTYMRWLAITYAPTMALCCAAALPCGVDHVRHAVRHPGHRPQRRRRAACWRWRTPWSRCWRRTRRRRGRCRLSLAHADTRPRTTLRQRGERARGAGGASTHRRTDVPSLPFTLTLSPQAGRVGVRRPQVIFVRVGHARLHDVARLHAGRRR